jgi:hypothetical protein
MGLAGVKQGKALAFRLRRRANSGNKGEKAAPAAFRLTNNHNYYQ